MLIRVSPPKTQDKISDWIPELIPVTQSVLSTLTTGSRAKVVNWPMGTAKALYYYANMADLQADEDVSNPIAVVWPPPKRPQAAKKIVPVHNHVKKAPQTPRIYQNHDLHPALAARFGVPAV